MYTLGIIITIASQLTICLETSAQLSGAPTRLSRQLHPIPCPLPRRCCARQLVAPVPHPPGSSSPLLGRLGSDRRSDVHFRGYGVRPPHPDLRLCQQRLVEGGGISALGQNDRSACSRGLRRAAGAYPAARSLPGWAFFLFCTWRASAAVAEEYCGLMYLAICAGTPVALLQVGPLTFCCQYLAAYIVAFLGSLGRRQSAALDSWILRGGTSSSLAENYWFRPDDHSTTLTLTSALVLAHGGVSSSLHLFCRNQGCGCRSVQFAPCTWRSALVLDGLYCR